MRAPALRLRVPRRPASTDRPGRSADDAPAPGTAAPDHSGEPVDVSHALSRSEAERLAMMLDHGLTGRVMAFPVTPDRLRSAIEIDLSAGGVEVVRLPGALQAPETWHVRLSATDGATATRLAARIRAARGMGPGDAR